MEFSIRFFSASAPIEMKSTRGAFCAFTRKICVHHSFALQALLHILDFSALLWDFFHFTSFERAMRWQNRAQEKEQQRSFQSFLFDWMRAHSESELNRRRSESTAGGISDYATVWSGTSSQLHKLYSNAEVQNSHRIDEIVVRQH